MSKTKKFQEISTPDMLPVILRQTKRSDEALYYLLTQRFRTNLLSIYINYKDCLDDLFEDTLNDFYIYLHDHGHTDADGNVYYKPLRCIRNQHVFKYWLLNTYRFYINNRLKVTIMTPLYENLPEDSFGNQDSVEDWESKVWQMSELIAYTYYQLNPINRFIFVRSLLRILNKKLCIKNEAMAKTIGMSYINYRVHQAHSWHRLRRYRNNLLHGARLQLDEKMLEMARHIYSRYGILLNCIRFYYVQALRSLPSQDAITVLLHKHADLSF